MKTFLKILVFILLTITFSSCIVQEDLAYGHYHTTRHYVIYDTPHHYHHHRVVRKAPHKPKPHYQKHSQRPKPQPQNRRQSSSNRTHRR